MKQLAKFLDTYIIIFFVAILASILTYSIPLGTYKTHKIEYKYNDKIKTKTVILPNTFELLKDKLNKPIKRGVPVFASGGKIGFFNYAFEGLVSGDKWGSAVGIVAFILLIGGAFGIVIRTSAVETALYSAISKTQNKGPLIISVMFILFSLGGAIFGMGEETLPFIILLIPLFKSMGYNSATAVMSIYVPTQIGFATSWMNPFSVAIAQGISQIPVMSGAQFRFLMWLFFTLVSLIYVLIYAKRTRLTPQEEHKDLNISSRLTIGHILVLLTILLTIVWLLWGVIYKGYYIPEMATQFFIMGIVVGIIGVVFKLNDMDISSIPESFRKGVKDIVGVALVVGMAKGIVLILGGDNPTHPSILNTILFYIQHYISRFPAYLAAWFMYVFQTIFNFFVVSGSGQAALTMPLMAPLADLVHVSRQTAVLAFQLGDGFTNLIVPTSAILMGAIGIAKIKWVDWLKIQLKFQLLLFTLASAFIFLAVFIKF